MNVRGGFGYKDNVLLGPMTKKESPFWQTGLDLMLLRLPNDGSQFYLFLTLDDVRYLRDLPVDKEQTLIAVAKFEKSFRNDWKAGISLQYLYQNQVLDVSATEAQLSTIQLKGHSVKLEPFLERKLSDYYSLKLEFPVNRQFLEEPLDDYWEFGPKLVLERSYGKRSTIAGSYSFTDRAYDDRFRTDASGTGIPDTSLKFYQHEFELIHKHYWDEKRRWRSDSRASFELNDDNGSGYFDYYRYGFSHQLRYSAPEWTIKTGARFYYYDYLVQTIQPDSADTRHLANWTVTLRAERNLTKTLKFYAQYDHEQSLSNRELNEYRANTVLAGLDWEL